MNTRIMRTLEIESALRDLRRDLGIVTEALPEAERVAEEALAAETAGRGRVDAAKTHITAVERVHSAEHQRPGFFTDLRGQPIVQPRVSCTCKTEIAATLVDLEEAEAERQRLSGVALAATRRRGEIRTGVRDLTRDIAQAEEELAIRAALPASQRHRPRPIGSPVSHLIPNASTPVIVA